MTARNAEKKAQRQAVLFEEKCRSGQVLDGSVRFADFAERWFVDYAERNLRLTTVSRYRLFMPRINAAIGHIRLDKLKPHHLMAFYKNLEESGIREDSKYHCVQDFKALLKQRGLTKRKFAPIAGVSVYVLDSITRGNNISQSSAEKVADALDENMEALFVRSTEKDKLSPHTVLHHHRLISSILSSAVKWQVIFSNPAARVEAPRNKRKEAICLDEEQAARLLELLDNESIQHRTIVKLPLYTGMRRGELCGLTWDDIDFDRALITISRSSLYLPGKGVSEDATKNETSQRCIKIPLDAVKMLREFRVWQAKERLQLGDQWQNNGRVFTTWNGAPIRPDTITGWFHKFVEKNGLSPVHIHSLRHTNASLLIASGTNIQTVAKRLGHANATATGKIYSHAIKSADEAATETLQDILHPVRKKA